MRERLTTNGKVVFDLQDGKPVGASEPRRTTVADVRRFLGTVYNLARTKQPLESPAEANRRAHICATSGTGGSPCPFNGPIEGCEVCKTVLRKVAEYVGTKTVDECNLLHGCQVCGCELKVAVWANLRAQQEATDEPTNARFPSFCWKKK